MKKFLLPAVLTMSLVANAASTTAPVAAPTLLEKISNLMPSCPVCISNAATDVKKLALEYPKTSAIVALVAVVATYKVVSYALSSEDEEDSAN